jgi:hypothetical protein
MYSGSSKTKKVQNNSTVTEQVNVTNLTLTKKHELFISYLNKAGFIGFAKWQAGERTYYAFTYETIEKTNKH